MTQVSATKIKDRIRIADLLTRLSLEPSRAGFVRCPAHADNTPSLKIYPESDSFYCFSCTAGGSVIDFYMLYADVDFSTAVEKLAGMFGVGKEMTRADRRVVVRQRHKQKSDAELKYWTAIYDKYRRILDRDYDMDKPLPPELVEACQQIAYAQYRMDLAHDEQLSRQ